MLLTGCIGVAGSCSQTPADRMEALRNDCLADLRNLLLHQQEWIKVHAAEYLLWTDYASGVDSVFTKEERTLHETPKYRIGIWRVLAQATDIPSEREKWIQRILAAHLDTNGNDRIHAVESLAKLGFSVYPEYQELTTMSVSEGSSPLALYTRWSIAYASPEKAAETVAFMVDLINEPLYGDDELSPRIASFILRQLGIKQLKQWETLRDAALQSSHSAGLRASLLATAWITAPETASKKDVANMKVSLMSLDRSPDVLPHMMMGLAAKGGAEDLAVAEAIFLEVRKTDSAAYDADAHAGAAYALLSILNRLFPHQLPE